MQTRNPKFADIAGYACRSRAAALGDLAADQLPHGEKDKSAKKRVPDESGTRASPR